MEIFPQIGNPSLKSPTRPGPGKFWYRPIWRVYFGFNVRQTNLLDSPWSLYWSQLSQIVSWYWPENDAVWRLLLYLWYRCLLLPRLIPGVCIYLVRTFQMSFISRFLEKYGYYYLYVKPKIMSKNQKSLLSHPILLSGLEIRSIWVTKSLLIFEKPE